VTTPPSGPVPEGSAAAPAIDWGSLIDDFGKLGRDAAEQFSKGASASASAVREGKYGTDDWLQDLEVFWRNLAGFAVEGIEILRKHAPK
jgi:hypothetical protein